MHRTPRPVALFVALALALVAAACRALNSEAVSPGIAEGATRW